MASNQLSIPNSNEYVTEGTVVILARFPGTKWVVHHGWYTYAGRQIQGWYFSSIPSQTIIPVNEDDLQMLTVVSGQHSNVEPEPNWPYPGPFPPGPCPPGPYPPGPYPPGPIPPHPPGPGSIPAIVTVYEKALYDSAFISVPKLKDRNRLNPYTLPDGKIVRVNNVDGEVKYYVWSKYDEEWSEILIDPTEVLKEYAKIEYVDEQVALINSEISEIHTDIDETNERVTAVETDLAAFEAQTNSAIESLNTSVSELQTGLASANEEIDSLKLRMGEAEDDIDNTIVRVSEAEVNIQNLNGQVDSLTTRIDTAEADIVTLEDRASASETRIETLEAQAQLFDDLLIWHDIGSEA